MKPESPALAGRFFPTEPSGGPKSSILQFERKKKKEQEAAEMLPVGLEEAKCHVVGITMWLTMSSDLWEMVTSALQTQETKFC